MHFELNLTINSSLFKDMLYRLTGELLSVRLLVTQSRCAKEWKRGYVVSFDRRGEVETGTNGKAD
jgi:hypothetical protein